MDKYNGIILDTSGHVPDSVIEVLIKTVNPKKDIIPIHTEKPYAFKSLKISQELTSKIVLLRDGEIFN